MCGTCAEMDVHPVPQGRLINRFGMVKVVAGFWAFAAQTASTNNKNVLKIFIRRKFGFETKTNTSPPSWKGWLSIQLIKIAKRRDFQLKNGFFAGITGGSKPQKNGQNPLPLRPEIHRYPDVVKLVDTSDLGSDAARCGGSSPSIRTNRPRVRTPHAK